MTTSKEHLLNGVEPGWNLQEVVEHTGTSDIHGSHLLSLNTHLYTHNLSPLNG